MAHAEKITLTEADTKLPANMAAFGPKALIAGIVLVVVGGLVGGLDHAKFSYLTAFAYWLTIALGGLVFLCLQHVSRAGWSVSIRRMIENVVSTLPWMFLLSLPIVIPTALGSDAIYKWNDPELYAFDQEFMPAKVPVYDGFLNNTFWTARVIGYFVIWSLLATFFVRHSRAQDNDGDHGRTRKMEILSAPAILLFALTLTFAGIDFLMTLDPHWFSTIWGVYLFSGAMTSFLSFLALLLMWLQSSGGLKDVITKEHYHDIGKFLFGFVFFFGYIGFSQYLLIWYANIPEETIFYAHRQEGAWTSFSLLLLFGHFLIPFLGLLSRHVKRHKPALAFWAVWMLVMHFVDMYWIVMPTLAQKLGDGTAIPFSSADVLIWLGMGGIFLWAVLNKAASGSIVPLRDPRLQESLQFHNI